MKIFQEVTEWKDVSYQQPNHVYLMDGDRAYAYSKWGEGQPEYFTPSRLDRRGRKFIEVKKNAWGFNLKLTPIQEKKPQGQTWQVSGSKGNTYTVSLSDGRWACTCPGATFRGACRHIKEKQEQS